MILRNAQVSQGSEVRRHADFVEDVADGGEASEIDETGANAIIQGNQINAFRGREGRAEIAERGRED